LLPSRIDDLIGKNIRVVLASGTIYEGILSGYSQNVSKIVLEQVKEIKDDMVSYADKVVIDFNEIIYVTEVDSKYSLKQPIMFLFAVALSTFMLFLIIPVYMVSPGALLVLFLLFFAGSFGTLYGIVRRSKAWFSGSLSIIFWIFFVYMSYEFENSLLPLILLVLAIATMALWASTAKLPVKGLKGRL